ncbi:hypothetical protein GCM10011383_28640 [Hymenobacter cavernae]|uniref:Transposase IS4-like domain-containing protein n=1 Tax=Hymenobacter cavernae TaxID=2044852 RepID=A0ABQ1UE66_9BACT|nr:hypothetical protein [Hymenobacter cavernae]GGF15629.1 hypothetical protein GCM10011383_28640 [Hymenobacter cavernae]
MLYADAAYTDYALEDAWREAEQVTLAADRRTNSKRPHEPWQSFLIQCFRKGVETTISQLTARFPSPFTLSRHKGLPSNSCFLSSPTPSPS